MTKGFTSKEQANVQQAKYRKNCTYVRKGHVIFLAEGGKQIHEQFTRVVKGITLPAINKAKKWVRENAAQKPSNAEQH